MIRNTSSKHWLIILGMHRSGTSALAGSLATSGVEFGQQLMAAQPTINAKGFWEHLECYAINEQLLAELSANWFFPFPIAAQLAAGWQPSPDLQTRMRNFLLSEEFATTTLCGLKDPRLCVLLPVWQPLFQELNHTVTYVLISRHPAEIAQSLATRDHMSPIHTEWLWREHQLYAEFYSRGAARCHLTFDELIAQPDQALQQIQQLIQLNLHINDTYNFVERDLKHHNTAMYDLTPLSQQLLAQLSRPHTLTEHHSWDQLRAQHSQQARTLPTCSPHLQGSEQLRHFSALMNLNISPLPQAP